MLSCPAGAFCPFVLKTLIWSLCTASRRDSNNVREAGESHFWSFSCKTNVRSSPVRAISSINNNNKSTLFCLVCVKSVLVFIQGRLLSLCPLLHIQLFLGRCFRNIFRTLHSCFILRWTVLGHANSDFDLVFETGSVLTASEL